MLLLLLTACAAYYIAALLAALRFSPLRPLAPSPHRPLAPSPPCPYPPVSLLKPVRGRDRDLYSCIRSYATQDYPEFELLFAVRDPTDPAVADIRRLAAEFPSRRIEVFVTDHEFGSNAKVNGLDRVQTECRYDLLVVSDSDIRVDPEYLRRIVAPLSQPGVGMVTCLYRGVPGGGLPSLLKALWISTDFQVSVLVARWLGIRFALGATMAFRRRDLDRIGGFARLAPYLADDYMLGKAISDLGARIVISDYPVETVLAKDSWADSWRHRIRWGRTLRVCRPLGYMGVLVTFAVPLAAFTTALQPALWPFAGVCLSLRLLAAVAVGIRTLRDPAVSRYFFLVPVSDVLSFVVWIASLFGRQVVWHGNRFRLERSGQIHQVG